MRNYILVTCDFSGLGLALDSRLKDSKVIVAYKGEEDEDPEELKKLEKSGKGLVRTMPLEKLFAKREQLKDWYWVFDSNHNWEYGVQLRKEGFKRVFGGTEFTYKLEEDRNFGMEFAEECGYQLPFGKDFHSVEEGIAFLEANEEKAFVYKPDNQDAAYTTVPLADEPMNANKEIRRLIRSLGFTEYYLQEQKRGIEVNTEVWFSHGKPIVAFADLEDKIEHNGDKGNATGCMFDVAWQVPIESDLIQMTVGKMFKKLEEINYTGLADCNAIISDYNDVWFLEYCFRLGFNMFPNTVMNLSDKPGLELLADLVDDTLEPKFKKGFGASVNVNTRLFKEGLPIYIPESVKKQVYLFDAMKDEDGEEGDMIMAGVSKEIAIAMAHSYTPQMALQDAMDVAEKIVFPRAYYRTDCCSRELKNSILNRYDALLALFNH